MVWMPQAQRQAPGKHRAELRDSQQAGSSSSCAEQQADLNTFTTIASICWQCSLPPPGESLALCRRPRCALSPAQLPSARPRSPLPDPATSGAYRRPRRRHRQRTAPTQMDRPLPSKRLRAPRRLPRRRHLQERRREELGGRQRLHPRSRR